MRLQTIRPNFVSTRNACKLCTPLGACIVFRGIEGAMPFLHGSQGCSTYIRRYVISHFREPIDVASSNFSEASAVFGGGENLWTGLDNVTSQYHPALIGIATTCLSETIGDNMPMLLSQYKKRTPAEGRPQLVTVSTPSYTGTHMDGFHGAVHAVTGALAEAGAPGQHVNLFPGFVSPEDLRHLKEIFADFGLDGVVLPDYSDALDGPAWEQYEKIPAGGTTVARLRSMGQARASILFGQVLPDAQNSALLLSDRFGVPPTELGMPIGISQSDELFAKLCELSGRPTPEKYVRERGRLVDSYIDGHKYVFGKRVIVYGEEDLVIGLTSFLLEIGAKPVLCASGGESGKLAEAIARLTHGAAASPEVRQGIDFVELGEDADRLKPDLLVGNSKGYSLARQLKIPLVRVGFPIHDRIGGQRVPHLGFRGAQRLFDQIVNALLEHKQEASDVGYSYM